MRRFLAFLASFVVALTFATNPTNAASNAVMSLRPSEQEVELTPGQQYTGSIVVYNVGKEAFDFEVTAAPYQVKSNNYEPDFLTESESTKLANWITFPTTEFSVEPSQSATVQFVVTVPEGVPGGGQRAAIIVRAKDDSSVESGVNLVTQIAAIVYGHIKGEELNATGSLSAYHFPTLMSGGEFKISSVIANEGNVDFRVTETLTISDFFTKREVLTPESTNASGYPVGTVSATVLPDTKRTIDMIWRDAPQLGIFRVSQTISYLDEEITTEKVVMVCPIWLIVLVGIMFLLIIIWLISAFRNYRKDRPQVL